MGKDRQGESETWEDGNWEKGKIQSAKFKMKEVRRRGSGKNKAQTEASRNRGG
jgi:hypothetical protein